MFKLPISYFSRKKNDDASQYTYNDSIEYNSTHCNFIVGFSPRVPVSFHDIFDTEHHAIFIVDKKLEGSEALSGVISKYFEIKYLPERLRGQARDHTEFIYYLEGGESAKSSEAVDDILNFISNFISNLPIAEQKSLKLTLIGVGGGTICDVTSYVSSIFKRGCDLCLVPTTLLAMVDASIGGKNAINWNNKKNYIGHYKDYYSVYIELDFLDTLPDDELNNGLAEIIKLAIVQPHLALYNRLMQDRSIDTELIKLAIDSKIFYLLYSSKETFDDNGYAESNVAIPFTRDVLNIGHKVAHYLEERYKIPHGKAVLIGLYNIIKIGSQKGYCESNLFDNFLNFLNYLSIDYSDYDTFNIGDSIKKEKYAILDMGLIQRVESAGQMQIARYISGFRAYMNDDGTFEYQEKEARKLPKNIRNFREEEDVTRQFKESYNKETEVYSSEITSKVKQSVFPLSKSIIIRSIIPLLEIRKTNRYIDFDRYSFPFEDGSDISMAGLAYANLAARETHISCLNSATLLRMLLPYCIKEFGKFRFYLGYQLIKRDPLKDYATIFPNLKITKNFNSLAPYIDVEGKIEEDSYDLTKIGSSQYASGLAMVLPLFKKPTKLILSKDSSSRSYIDLTLYILTKAGIKYTIDDTDLEKDIIQFSENQKYKWTYDLGKENWYGLAPILETDIGLIINTLLTVDGGQLMEHKVVTHVKLSRGTSLQPEFKAFEMLNEIGFNYTLKTTGVLTFNSQPHVIKPFDFDFKNNMDMVITFAFLALETEDLCYLRNIDRLRFKESNRLQAIIDVYDLLGVGYSYNDGTLTVDGSSLKLPIKDKEIDYDAKYDHRVTYGLMMLAERVNLTINIIHPDTSKTFPGYALKIRQEIREKSILD